ncbi:S8 family serine peptidase [Parvicella tangerina]|uniref:Peptidase S8/S53 domain-containing protein n=1 Tax=Parvicella tangerina TaxID=2829795 RepID=A0A916N8Y9_9FLAO|nr:S8 family serine peptidase [Parvicella tangerina]CAG5077877.1 hypothetical protein CRYO30217_00505 [Parvicella tangerina]
MEGNWNRIFFLMFFSFVCHTSLWAQQDTLFYRIQFTDKNNTPFIIQQPTSFLSQKAIARREKSGIPIKTQDLPIDPNYITQVLSYASVNYITHSKWFNQLVVVSNDTNDINAIQLLPFVANTKQFVKPIDKFPIADKKLSISSPKESIVVNPHYPYGITYAQNHLHHLDFMHDLAFNGQGIDIAVIDSGFDNAIDLEGIKHLFANGQILSTYDFVDREESVTEDHFHGSAVLSVMAGFIEGEFYGSSTLANFHLLRSEDANAEYIIEEDFWVCAAEYADSAGCDIINTSLGYSTFDDSTQNHTYADLDGNTTLIARASDIASSKGILCVTSAGNLGNSDWGYISTPADADSTLTIGAIDQYNQIAPFSSYGPSADGDIKPNLVSVGWLTQLIAPWDNAIIQGNGTSFSAPMVSGLAACLWQALPELNNMELKSLLETTASQANLPDTLRGFGYPRVFEAYSSQSGITYQSPSHLEIMSVFPNPVATSQALSLKVASNLDTEAEVLLINVLGQVTYRHTISLNTGVNMITIRGDLRNAKGVYSIILQNENEFTQERLIFQ